MRKLLFVLFVVGFIVSVLAGTAQAAPVVLDGTSGDNTITGTFDTTGDLTLNLGFFAEYLVVAGGGGGGENRGGGGGAGGMLTGTIEGLAAVAHTITVGAGGSGAGHNQSGGDGGNSSIGSLVTATGGGGGGRFSTGRAGGSGGGGGSSSAGGSGIAGQGHNGGHGITDFLVVTFFGGHLLGIRRGRPTPGGCVASSRGSGAC